MPEIDRYGQKAAEAVQDTLYTVCIEEFLAFIIDVQYHIGAAFGLLCLFQRIFRRAIAFPASSRRIFFITFGEYFYLIAHHKGRVKTQTEFSDDIILVLAFVLFHERSEERRVGKEC